MLGIQAAKTTKGAEMSRDLGVYNIWDIRREAKKRLPKGVFEYIDRGAEDEIALRNNRAAFDKLKFVNRVLVDVSKRKLNYEFLGKPISMPFGISPTGTVEAPVMEVRLLLRRRQNGGVSPVAFRQMLKPNWKKFGIKQEETSGFSSTCGQTSACV